MARAFQQHLGLEASNRVLRIYQRRLLWYTNIVRTSHSVMARSFEEYSSLVIFVLIGDDVGLPAISSCQLLLTSDGSTGKLAVKFVVSFRVTCVVSIILVSLVPLALTWTSPQSVVKTQCTLQSTDGQQSAVVRLDCLPVDIVVQVVALRKYTAVLVPC